MATIAALSGGLAPKIAPKMGVSPVQKKGLSSGGLSKFSSSVRVQSSHASIMNSYRPLSQPVTVKAKISKLRNFRVYHQPLDPSWENPDGRLPFPMEHAINFFDLETVLTEQMDMQRQRKRKMMWWYFKWNSFSSHQRRNWQKKVPAIF